MNNTNFNIGENSFLQSILHLRRKGNNESNWSKGIVLSFENTNFDNLPYYQSQVLEPSVLYEVAKFSNISLQDIETLNYNLEGQMKSIKWMIDNVDFATPVQKLSLSFALSSIARYKLANFVFQKIDPSRLLVHERVYYYFQKFIIKNRENPTNNCEQEFTFIKELLEEKKLTLNMQLFFSGQVIVWYTKTNFVSKDLFNWYLNLGLSAVNKLKDSVSFGDLHSLSNFYRAYAMISADQKDISATIDNMNKCLYYAECLKPADEFQQVIKTDTLKTYYESTVKTHMYVTKDLQKAEEACLKLISLDPNWSISYQELGDVYMKMGYAGLALKQFRTSQELVQPRYAVALYKEAEALEKMEAYTEALEIYKNLLKFDPLNISSGINGLEIAEKLDKKEYVKFFKSYIEEWSNNEDLSKYVEGVLVK